MLRKPFRVHAPVIIVFQPDWKAFQVSTPSVIADEQFAGIKAQSLECLDVRMLLFGASLGPPEHCSPTVRRHEGLGQHVLEYGATVPDSAPHDCGSPGLPYMHET